MILYQHRVQSSLDMYITTLMDKQLGCILVEAHCGEESRGIERNLGRSLQSARTS